MKAVTIAAGHSKDSYTHFQRVSQQTLHVQSIFRVFQALRGQQEVFDGAKFYENVSIYFRSFFFPFFLGTNVWHYDHTHTIHLQMYVSG